MIPIHHRPILVPLQASRHKGDILRMSVGREMLTSPLTPLHIIPFGQSVAALSGDRHHPSPLRACLPKPSTPITWATAGDGLFHRMMLHLCDVKASPYLDPLSPFGGGSFLSLALKCTASLIHSLLRRSFSPLQST